jgi:hypothetical protein
MGFATPPGLVALRGYIQLLRILRMFRAEISANCAISRRFFWWRRLPGLT